MIIYISGPYRADTEWEVEQNIRKATDAAAEVWRMGHVAICPHLNTAHMGGVVSHGRFIVGDIEIISRLLGAKDGILMLEGWRNSGGAKAEHFAAKGKELFIFYSLEQLREHGKQDR